MAHVRKAHLALFAINVAILVVFGWVFWVSRNYEFIMYVAVVGGAIAAAMLTLKRVPYTLDCLIGLTVWAGLHMAGGGVRVSDEVGCLYNLMLWPMSETLPILRFDQFVHIVGFGAATLLMHCLLAGSLRKPIPGKVALGIVLVMAGLGVGAFNEIVEFIATLAMSQTGVGGYTNTALDMCANLIGAILAVVYLGLRGRLTCPEALPSP
ncbi:MAG: DUF2238 domain-containing protein [Planctomycetota bacterium]|jgi:putative membrane protein